MPIYFLFYRWFIFSHSVFSYQNFAFAHLDFILDFIRLFYTFVNICATLCTTAFKSTFYCLKHFSLLLSFYYILLLLFIYCFCLIPVLSDFVYPTHFHIVFICAIIWLIFFLLFSSTLIKFILCICLVSVVFLFSFAFHSI